jgi:hypothetical protein
MFFGTIYTMQSENDTVVNLILELFNGLLKPNRVSQHILMFSGLSIADRV